MMLQEAIDFQEYYRCYYVGGRVRVMPYEPRNPHHLRYVQDAQPNPELIATIEDYVIRLCETLGYDFNTVEFAVRDGVPYAIDFCNPAPDAELNSVGAENFEWVVENAAQFAIERALEHEENSDNLTWGIFIEHGIQGGSMEVEKVEDNPAGFIADEVIAILEAELEGAIQEELEGLSKEQIEQLLDGDFIEELAEEAIEEILEEIVELFEEDDEEDEDEESEDEAVADTTDSTGEAVGEEEEEEDEEEDETSEESEEDEEENETSEENKEEEVTEKPADSKTALFAIIGTATEAEKNDLKKIKGVGAILEKALNAVGVFTFEQVSKMGDAEYDLLDDLVPSTKGRPKRDDWAGQAKTFITA
jgi:predicted flap endonuclease-1-like 5' DNA nuclease